MTDSPTTGPTAISLGLARALVLAFVLMLGSVPIGQNVFSGAGVSLGQKSSWERFWNEAKAVLEDSTEDFSFFAANRRLKKSMEDLERSLEDDSFLQALTLPPVQWWMSGWGGAGNEKIYIGYEGWLFYRPGVDYVVGPPFLEPRILKRRTRHGDPRPVILDFHRQLEEHGIRLLLVPVPTKVTIYPQGLAPEYAARRPGAAALQNPSHDEFLDGLEKAGVEVFDPTETLLELGAAAFLRTDSHWSPAGVERVARALADRIRELDIPFREPETPWRRSALTHTGRGDLARTLRLPDWGELYPPETVRLERVADPRGQLWRSDPEAEILLLGDSFTNVYSEPGLLWGQAAGLAEQLSFHLRRKIHRAAVDNAGATGSRQLFARQLADQRTRLETKKLVVWEVAVRELMGGDWRPVPL